MPPRGVWPAALVVVVSALLGAACESARQTSTCARSGTAQLCLVGGSSGYTLEGSGFQANSEATLTIVGGGGHPMGVPINAEGVLAGGMTLVGVLAGSDPQVVVVTGTSSADEPAEFELTVPAR